MGAACAQLLLTATLWMMPHMGAAAAAAVLTSSTELLNTTRAGPETESDFRVLTGAVGAPHSRRKRAISFKEINALLDYHNRVRSQVFPPAANMEYMLWDEGLAKSADSWASRCVWDHGPTQAMKYMGQNLSITSGRYQSITDLVRSWYDERHHFSYPNRCSGSVCSHYTQMVWASTNKMGCAVRKCSNMYVFGSTWREAMLLVCNYSIKGNWVGEAPYKSGKPCSVCPSSYGGSCWRNQCSPNTKPKRLARY
ncbi:R3H domain containing-like isoform X2 [Siniperca chuatsi]|nr:R3H domain containing-like isoform X2 [Siniperca chuatsi]